MSRDHVPTLWLPRGNPASVPFSATGANKLEDGIRAAHERIADPCFRVFTTNLASLALATTDLAPGDRALLAAQTSPANNGVYTYDGETLTRDAAELYRPGRLFPVVTQTILGLDKDYASPEVWVCGEAGGSEGYTFAKVGAIPSASARSLKAVLTANVNPASGGVVVFNSVERGPDWLDETNGRIAPQVPGLYRARCALAPATNASAAGQTWEADLRKNAGLIDVKWLYAHASGFRTPVVAEATAEMNGTTDFFDALRTTTYGTGTIQAVSYYSYLEVTYLGPLT